MAYKKIKSGEANFISEQSFNTVEDAHKETNPINEEEVTIQDIKIDNTRIKKEVIEDVVGQQDRTTK